MTYELGDRVRIEMNPHTLEMLIVPGPDNAVVCGHAMNCFMVKYDEEVHLVKPENVWLVGDFPGKIWWRNVK